MDDSSSEPIPSNPLRWFPEFLRWDRQRARAQLRVMGSALLVGVVAGLGAAAFSLACHAVEHYALGELIGYHPTRPHGEPRLSWVAESETPLRPWLLLVVPTVGGLL